MFQTLAEVLVPVYLIVGVGFAVAKATPIKPESLATLAYWVLGPIFVFDVLADARLEAEVVGKVFAGSFSTLLVVGVVAWAIMRALGIDESRRAATILTSTYGNAGNFGLAICAFALGEDALPIAGIALVTINTTGILIGVGLAERRAGSVWTAARRAVTSPLALAVVPAALVNATGSELPLWLDRPIALVAGALIPVMLLTLGIQIARMPRIVPETLTAIPISLKLVVSPVVALAVIAILGLGGDAAGVVLLQAAMPAAVFTALISMEHDLVPDFTTSVVLTGTLASVVTLPVVLALL